MVDENIIIDMAKGAFKCTEKLKIILDSFYITHFFYFNNSKILMKYILKFLYFAFKFNKNI